MNDYKKIEGDKAAVMLIRDAKTIPQTKIGISLPYPKWSVFTYYIGGEYSDIVITNKGAFRAHDLIIMGGEFDDDTEDLGALPYNFDL